MPVCKDHNLSRESVLEFWPLKVSCKFTHLFSFLLKIIFFSEWVWLPGRRGSTEAISPSSTDKALTQAVCILEGSSEFWHHSAWTKDSWHSISFESILYFPEGSSEYNRFSIESIVTLFCFLLNLSELHCFGCLGVKMFLHGHEDGSVQKFAWRPHRKCIWHPVQSPAGRSGCLAPL